MLTGTEVKSLRGGKAQIKDGYAAIKNGELWLFNVHIPPYAPASRDNHEPERERKLLVHRAQLERLAGQTSEKGLTIVPTRLYFSGGRAKVELAARARQGRRRQAPDDQGAREPPRDGPRDPRPRTGLAMAHIAVSNLAYAHPGGDTLFYDVSLPAARRAARRAGRRQRRRQDARCCGSLAGRARRPTRATSPSAAGALYMAQDVGTRRRARVRELLLRRRARAACATPACGCSRPSARWRPGDAATPACALGEAIGDWSELGGYELEGQWDAACRRIVRARRSTRSATARRRTLSGGERKRLVLDLLFASDAPVLLLDEPDNFLDVPAKRALEARSARRARRSC